MNSMCMRRDPGLGFSGTLDLARWYHEEKPAIGECLGYIIFNELGHTRERFQPDGTALPMREYSVPELICTGPTSHEPSVSAIAFFSTAVPNTDRLFLYQRLGPGELDGIQSKNSEGVELYHKIRPCEAERFDSAAEQRRQASTINGNRRAQ